MLSYFFHKFSFRFLPFILTLGLFLGIPDIIKAQVLINQVDDFNDGTLQGWTRGMPVDTFVSNRDNMLKVSTVNNFNGGPFSKLIIYNETQWKGDYISQGITGIRLKISNPYNPIASNNPLRIRIAIGNTDKPGPNSSKIGTWFVSKESIEISPELGIVDGIISIKEEDLNVAQGTDSYASVLGDVKALRILASNSSSDPRGDANVIATVLIDDITACGDCTATEIDLSDDGLNPTMVQFSGDKDTVSNCFDNSDVDYFTFEVPTDSVLTGIKLTKYDNGAPSDQAFLGIQKGTTFTEPRYNANVANLLGGIVFGENNVGTDILPEMGTLNGSQGFTAPLTAGNYTIWLNQFQGLTCVTFQFLFEDKDLSDDRMNPTSIAFSETMDTVSNCQKGNPRDIDYFTFNVPQDTVLSELILKNYEASDTSTNKAFIGIQAGTTFTVDPFNPSANDLLGGLTYGTSQIGMDILPLMGNLGTGFTPPLTTGNYTIWLNQTGPASCATLQVKLAPVATACSDTLFFNNQTVNSGTYSAADTILTNGNVLIANNSTVVFQAGKVIQLTSGFHAMAASNFLAQISDCTPVTSLSTIQNEINQQVFLAPFTDEISLNVYPNPFYNSTTIEYQLNSQEKVNVFIYDLSGKLVKTMVKNELQPIGTYQYEFIKEDLQKGMYLLYLKTEKEQVVKKMMLID